MSKKLLLVVDPQNDFVDPRGSLYVQSGDLAVEELIKFITSGIDDSTDIVLTQDTHFSYNLGHECFWDSTRPLDPFTKITAEDIETGRVVPKSTDLMNDWIKDSIIKAAKDHGGITIWPEHCIYGTWGWAFPDSLIKAINDRGKRTNSQRRYEIIQKGLNPFVECFSVFTNDLKIGEFRDYDKIYIAGVAKDVCVASTVRDMIFSGLYENKLVFLNGCMATIDPSAESLKIFREAIKYQGATEQD